jgi:hypothetical protein
VKAFADLPSPHFAVLLRRHGAAIEQNAPGEKEVKERVKACEAHSFTHNKLNHNHLQNPLTV